MPRYEFHRNQGLMVVEDLENSLGRKQLIGYPPRHINPYYSVYPTGWLERQGPYPRLARGCGYCTRMEQCQCFKKVRHCYCC